MCAIFQTRAKLKHYGTSIEISQVGRMIAPSPTLERNSQCALLYPMLHKRGTTLISLHLMCIPTSFRIKKVDEGGMKNAEKPLQVEVSSLKCKSMAACLEGCCALTVNFKQTTTLTHVQWRPREPR